MPCLANIKSGADDGRHDSFRMILIERTGDLFTSKDSKCHCVSSDHALGAGIALQFRRLYGRVEELKKMKKTVGEVSFIKLSNGEYIFNLITKVRYWQKPSYRSLRRCLEELASLCENLGVSRLSMPRIACGLDRLEWKNVKQMLLDIWSEKDMTITVYYLQ